MNAARFLAPAALGLLWAVPVIAGLYLLAERARRSALARFAHPAMAGRLLAGVNPWIRGGGAVAMTAAAALLALSLARPAWNPRPETVSRAGRDVVFVVDVSRSMLAEDLKPSRMRRAQFAILDAIDELEGDRVALVVFAGRAVLRCPLTHDYGFFRMMVESLNPDSLTPGGTRIGDAVRLATEEVFQDQERAYKDVVLITDGEDHDSDPVEAARTASEAGIRLIAIGLGNESTGARIPLTDEEGNRSWALYEGQEVLTKLDAAKLREMTAATPGGRYFNVATGTIDLGEIYRNVIRSDEKTRLESETVVRWDEQFQLFLAPAVLLLLAQMGLAERRRRAP